MGLESHDPLAEKASFNFSFSTVMRPKVHFFALLLTITLSAFADSMETALRAVEKPSEPAALLMPSGGNRTMADFNFEVPELDALNASSPPPLTSRLEGNLNESIVQLPEMRVSIRRTELSDTDILNDRGLVEYAKKKYTTPLYRSTFGPLSQLGAYYFNFLAIFGGWHPSEAEAMTLYREDERIRILTEFDELLKLESISPSSDFEQLKSTRFGLRLTGIQALYWNPFKRH